MTSDGFNLVDQPWISVLTPDGRELEVSMLELFEQAPRLSVIGGEVPTQSFAITRLLLAFLHEAIEGPADQDEWAALWSADELPLDQIADYAGRVRHRFDLFDTQQPFFQVADLRTAKDEVSGLEKLVADVPNGEPLFTTRSAASLRSISPAEAARWLVHVHAFDPSGIKSGAVGDKTVKNGKGYPIGTGWSGRLGGVLAQGRNLRETLLLNLVAWDTDGYVRVGGKKDLPPWHRDPDTALRPERLPTGAMGLYTWQSRRVRLVGDRCGVTGVVLANGDRIEPQNLHALEPHSAWRHSKAQSTKYKSTVYMPLTHDPNRSVWRGLAAFLPPVSSSRRRHGDPEKPIPPGVLEWVAELAVMGKLPRDYVVGLRVHGVEYGAQSATYAEIVDDVLPLPVVLLRRDLPDAGHAAERAVSDAAQAAKALWRFAENLAQAAGAEPKSGAGTRAEEEFYSLLERPYRDWLRQLGPDTALTEASASWQRTVRRQCRRVAEQLVDSAPPSSWTGREINKRVVNVAQAEVWFNAAVHKALPLAFDAPQAA